MTPTEFIKMAFVLLSQVSSLMLTEYFTDDPSGVTVSKIALEEVAKGITEMTLNITWANTTVLSYTATGATAWQETTALGLIETPTGEAA